MSAKAKATSQYLASFSPSFCFGDSADRQLASVNNASFVYKHSSWAILQNEGSVQLDLSRHATPLE